MVDKNTSAGRRPGQTTPRGRSPAPAPPVSPLLRPSDYGKLVGLRPKRVQQLCRDGTIPCEKYGNQYFIPRWYVERLYTGTPDESDRRP